MITTTPVLVVDDANLIRQILFSMLGQIGFQDVDITGRSHDALPMLLRKSYGLIIADWNMSPVNGFELLKRVRLEPSLVDIPFIMITGSALQSRVLAARDAGATSFLVKPFTISMLEAKIRASLGVG